MGTGGSGSVQKFYDTQKRQFIAIKKSLEMQESDTLLENDLLKEVEKIRSTRKKNEQYFLQYHGVFCDPKKPKSLSLHLEQGLFSLKNILKGGKKYPCKELIHVHRKLSEGYALLQENGIANRDVKPDNIILVENPKIKDSFHYKIIDFGIGCKMEKGTCTTTIMSLKGFTPGYEAPEVIIYAKRIRRALKDGRELTKVKFTTLFWLMCFPLGC